MRVEQERHIAAGFAAASIPERIKCVQFAERDCNEREKLEIVTEKGNFPIAAG